MSAVFSDDQPPNRIEHTPMVPPHSLEAEQSVIGGLMLDNQAWDKVCELVGVDDFYRGEHRLIFDAIGNLANAGHPFDVVTLAEQLRARGKLHDAGDLAYLTLMSRETPSAANIASYARIVREQSVLRQLIATGNNIAGMGFSPEGRAVNELLDSAESELFAIAEQQRRKQSGFVALRDLLKTAVDKVDEMAHHDGGVSGLATGLTDFDDMTTGLHPGDLVIVAGRPSMGKTSLAINFAEHACMLNRVPTAVFSMEMPGDQIAMRLISSHGRIDQQRLRNGQLQDQDWASLQSAVGTMNEKPFFVDDTPAMSPTELRARARRLQREHGLGLIVVDYIQLMQVPGNKENRTNEIAEISRSLKALAKELSLPVIALSQLNRGLEQRDNKRPRMSDLRESGGIEQDADLIVFIYRDEVYNPEATENQGIAELIIAKQRNGPTGVCKTAFLKPFTKFENLARDRWGVDEYE